MLKVGPRFDHFSYFHSLSPWPTPGLPGTQFPMRWLKRIIIVLKSVNNFPFFWVLRYHALEKTWNMLKMLHNFPHRQITTTPRLKPFEFLDIPHSLALSGWVGLSWVLGFRVVVSCCCLILDFKNNLFGLNFNFSIFLGFWWSFRSDL